MKRFMIVLGAILLLVGCSGIPNDPNATTENESRVVVENKKSDVNLPGKVTFTYYVSQNSPLYGKDMYYTFHLVTNRYGGSYDAFALEKTEDGYKILNGDDKGFVISEKGGMEDTNVVLLDKTHGTFSIYFDGKVRYEYFYHDEPTEMVWFDAATVRKKQRKK
jgi:hypothetical protein